MTSFPLAILNLLYMVLSYHKSKRRERLHRIGEVKYPRNQLVFDVVISTASTTQSYL